MKRPYASLNLKELQDLFHAHQEDSVRLFDLLEELAYRQDLEAQVLRRSVSELLQRRYGLLEDGMNVDFRRKSVGDSAITPRPVSQDHSSSQRGGEPVTTSGADSDSQPSSVIPTKEALRAHWNDQQGLARLREEIESHSTPEALIYLGQIRQRLRDLATDTSRKHQEESYRKGHPQPISGVGPD